MLNSVFATGTTAALINSDTDLPAKYQPFADIYTAIRVRVAGVDQVGLLRIQATGNIQISSDIPGNNFSGMLSEGFDAWSITYNMS